MSKTLKFASHLVPLVLSGEKYSTWRLWDDKELSQDDIVQLVNSNDKTVFATAKVTKVIEKTMGKLTIEDKEGHETFDTDQEMYDTYSHYYGKTITTSSPVKILWFRLVYE